MTTIVVSIVDDSRRYHFAWLIKIIIANFIITFSLRVFRNVIFLSKKNLFFTDNDLQYTDFNPSTINFVLYIRNFSNNLIIAISIK